MYGHLTGVSVNRIYISTKKNWPNTSLRCLGKVDVKIRERASVNVENGTQDISLFTASKNGDLRHEK